jgi:uncharacterized phage protein (TIGR01671 family)
MKNREIKFRVWDGKSMYRIEGLRWILFGSPEEGKGIRVDENGQNDWETLRLDDNKCVLMQFTGLLDKNGKEIYESDIVSRKERIGVIGWNDGGFCIDTVKIEGKFVEYREPFFTQPIMEGWEVIGNIFENSELISK